MITTTYIFMEKWRKLSVLLGWKKHFIKGYGNHILLYVPPPWGGRGGHIVFSADPVGVGVTTCLHSISLLNGQILAKLTQINHWEEEKCWLDFGDLDIIFKVTGGLRLLENGA